MTRRVLHDGDSETPVGPITEIEIVGLRPPGHGALAERVARLEQVVLTFVDVFKDLGVTFEGDDDA